MKTKISLRSIWWPAVIVSAVAIYFAVMALSIGQSIWFDEGYSILLAKSNWTDLFALTAVDAHPPLYYAVLKIWGELFGFSEFALRSLSAILLSGSVVAVAVLLRKLFSTKVALLTLPVILLAPFLLRYGYEVRMYSMALLIGVMATYVLINAQRTNKWWQWFMYAAFVALGMYTLYMTIVVWLAHVVWLFIQSIKKPRKKFLQWRWLYAFAGAVILFVPYIPTFLHQTLNSALPGIGNEMTLTRLVDITTVLFTFTPEWQVGGLLSILILISTALTVFAGVKTRKYLSANEKRSFALLACLVLVPLAFYALTSLPPREPIFVNRYLAHIAIFIYALIGVTLALAITYRQKLGKKQRIIPFVAYGVVLVILAIGLVRLQSAGNFVFERMQSPQTQAIRSSIECNDQTTIIADDPYTYIDSVFYFDGCDMRFYSQTAIEKKGGYAPLHDSTKRVASAEDITSPIIIRLGWDGKEAGFKPSDRYALVYSKVHDKQLVEMYRLSAE